jgi:hypothetical protein
MPPQVIRLVLLTIGIVCVYFTARYFLTPETFGQNGHYRGAALREIASRQPYWAGKAACVAECHTDHAAKLAGGAHKSLSCETCHGPGAAHVKNPAEKLPKLDMSLCLRCHAASPSRPAWMHQINVHDHYAGNLCTDCHVPHQPNEVPP